MLLAQAWGTGIREAVGTEVEEGTAVAGEEEEAGALWMVMDGEAITGNTMMVAGAVVEGEAAVATTVSSSSNSTMATITKEVVVVNRVEGAGRTVGTEEAGVATEAVDATSQVGSPQIARLVDDCRSTR